VSHDREFLDKTVTRIVEIENYRFQNYDGNFTEYVRQKQIRIRKLENQFKHEEELLVFEAEAIRDRREMRRNPSRAIERRLANIKKRVEPRPIDKVVTKLYESISVGNVLCRVKELTKAYGDEILFMDLSFDINRGDRIVVVGPNGCGKTTLLGAVTGGVHPDDGDVTWIGGVQYCFYNDVLADLDPEDTVTHAVNVVPLAFGAARKTVNRFLSLLQFSEMDLHKRIGTLSGGQKARVALAQCLLSGAALIVMDEPTNHLDVTSTQVMERALVNFPGALLTASHDRFFIDKVATKMLVFAGEGTVEEFAGSWSMRSSGPVE
jgi:ATP-binding cassette subfamily F protein 3